MVVQDETGPDGGGTPPSPTTEPPEEATMDDPKSRHRQPSQRLHLTPYAELAGLIDSLPLLIRETRRARGLTLSATAAESGLSAATIHRLEHNDNCSAANLRAILRWLGRAA